jgi:very-short-patch-repair endonuclease
VPDGPPTIVELVTELGGVATRPQLLEAFSRREVDAALAAGELVRIARGRYALPSTDEVDRIVAELGGVLALTSAAMRHGWSVKVVPDRAHVMVSRGRRLPEKVRSAYVHRDELRGEDVVDGATRPAITLAHCLRRLPFDEALCVADSALRSGFPRRELLAMVDSARGPGSPQMRRVGHAASNKAANVFESTVRAIALQIAELNPRPQVEIRGDGYVARPDLVDVRLRIVIEADSFEWHGGRDALSADARRYDLLVADGWLVLRFSYEHVMTQPDFVQRILVAVVARALRMREVGLFDVVAA